MTRNKLIKQVENEYAVFVNSLFLKTNHENVSKYSKEQHKKTKQKTETVFSPDVIRGLAVLN